MHHVARTRKKAERGGRAFVDVWVDCFSKHKLLTYASAIAFQLLIALVPLTVLTLGVLGALDEDSVWKKQIAPGIEKHLPAQTWQAVNYAAERIISHASVGLIVFGVALMIWEVSGSVRATMGAMNKIYDNEEERSRRLRLGISVGLAIAIGVCFVGSILVLTLAKHLGGSALRSSTSAGGSWPSSCSASRSSSSYASRRPSLATNAG